MGLAGGVVGDAHRAAPRCVPILPPEHSGFPPPPLGSHPASALPHGVSASTSLCLWALGQGRWASRVQGILQDGGHDVARTPFRTRGGQAVGLPGVTFSCARLWTAVDSLVGRGGSDGRRRHRGRHVGRRGLAAGASLLVALPVCLPRSGGGAPWRVGG